MQKYYIITYGCQMNVHESEKIAGMLVELGYESVDTPENADLIVFGVDEVGEAETVPMLLTQERKSDLVNG